MLNPTYAEANVSCDQSEMLCSIQNPMTGSEDMT